MSDAILPTREALYEAMWGPNTAHHADPSSIAHMRGVQELCARAVYAAGIAEYARGHRDGLEERQAHLQGDDA